MNEPWQQSPESQPPEPTEEQQLVPASSNRKLLYITLGILAVLFVIGGGIYIFEKYDDLSFSGCTEEAKICPDGSTVGRIPPLCEFEECPSITPNGVGNGNDSSSDTSAPVSDETAGWNTYRNEEYGFGVKYPPNWKKVDLGTFGFELTPEVERIPESVTIIVRAGGRTTNLGLAGELVQHPAECSYKEIGGNRFCFASTRFEGSRLDYYGLEKNSVIYKIGIRVNGGRQGMTYYIPDSELEGELEILNGILSTFKFAELIY